MTMTKRTLRRLKPRTRKFAQAVNELERALKRLKRHIAVHQQMEVSAEAVQHTKGRLPPPNDFDHIDWPPFPAYTVCKTCETLDGH